MLMASSQLPPSVSSFSGQLRIDCLEILTNGAVANVHFELVKVGVDVLEQSIPVITVFFCLIFLIRTSEQTIWGTHTRIVEHCAHHH